MLINKLELEGYELTIETDSSNLKNYTDAKITDIYIDTFDSYNDEFKGKYHYSLTQEEKNNSKFSEVFLPANFTDVDDPKRWCLKFGDIVFVKIIFDGIEKSNTECGIKKEVYGVAVNWKRIYNLGIQYTKELEQNCNNKVNLIDYNMRLKALELAVKYGDCAFAYDMFKYYFNRSVNKNICNCSK